MDPRIVYQDVEGPPGGKYVPKQRSNLVLFGHVSPDGHCVNPTRLKFVHNCIGDLSVRNVVDRDCCAGCGQSSGYALPDSRVGPGHKGLLSSQWLVGHTVAHQASTPLRSPNVISFHDVPLAHHRSSSASSTPRSSSD